MATLNATNLKHASSSSNNIVLAADGSTTISNLSGGVGKILQVVQTFKKDAFSTSNSSPVEITGFNASITKTSASNKILIRVVIGYGKSGQATSRFVLYEDSSELTDANGTSGTTDNVFIADYKHVQNDDAEKYSWNNVSKSVLIDGQNDTSSHTYKVYGNCNEETLYINRRGYDTAYGITSSITLMEVAA